jgi:hypothetical protein
MVHLPLRQEHPLSERIRKKALPTEHDTGYHRSQPPRPRTHKPAVPADNRNNRGGTMLNNKWFCEPNPFRETYCYMSIQKKTIDNYLQITGWQTATANMQSIVTMDQYQDKDEKKAIQELLKKLSYCIEKNITLITPTNQTMPLLRTRILTLNIPNVSFTTIKTICIEHLMEKYFTEKTTVKDTPKNMHRIFTAIAPLISQEELL